MKRVGGHYTKHAASTLAFVFMLLHAAASLRLSAQRRTIAPKTTSSSCHQDGRSSWPINAVHPIEPSGYCKTEPDVCPSIFLPSNRIWQELAKFAPESMSYYAINVGANDGIHADPIYPLLQAHPDTFGVLQIEGGDEVQALRKNMAPFPRANVRHAKVYPSNIKQMCHDAEAAERHRLGDSKTIDYLKIDIDGCECHMLSELLSDAYFHAKIISVELNHYIPPPIAYANLCAVDTFGRASASKDVWGCSMQAAYDIASQYGYELLQYDWPDANFVHQKYRDAFPCLLGEQPGSHYEHNYWVGYHHAKEKYTRFKGDIDNVTFVESMLPLMATRAYLHPEETVEYVYDNFKQFLTKRPLLVNVSIGGAGRRAVIRAGETDKEPSLLWV